MSFVGAKMDEQQTERKEGDKATNAWEDALETRPPKRDWFTIGFVTALAVVVLLLVSIALRVS